MIQFILVLFVVYAYFLFNKKINILYSRIKELERRLGNEGRSIYEKNAVPEKAEGRTDLIGAVADEDSGSVRQDSRPEIVSGDVVSKNPILESGSVSTNEDLQKGGELSEEKIGRWIGVVGLVALVVGVGFFIQYAFQNDWIGETARIILGLIVGILFVGLGQYLFNKYHNYAQIISATGIVILYLSIFSAFGFYSLIGIYGALFCIFTVSVLAGVISVFRDALSLAYLGVVGGFVVPLFMSGGVVDLSFVGLLIYVLIVTILGLSVAYVGGHKKLSLVSLSGGYLVPYILIVGGLSVYPIMSLVFLFVVAFLGVGYGFLKGCLETFIVAVAGGWIVPVFMLQDHFSDIIFFLLLYVMLMIPLSLVGFNEPFKKYGVYIAFVGTLILGSIALAGKDISLFVQSFFITAYFLFFVLAIYGLSLYRKLSLVVSADVVFSVFFTSAYAVAGVMILDKFGLEYFQGYFLLLIALFYLAISAYVYDREKDYSLVFLNTLGLGLVCLAVSVPLQFSGPWISLAWIFLSVMFLYIAVNFIFRYLFVFSVLVLVIATVKVLFIDIHSYNLASFIPMFNNQFVLLVFLTGGFAWFGYFLHKRRQVWDKLAIKTIFLAFLVVVVNVLALGSLTFETWRFYESRYFSYENEVREDIDRYLQSEMMDRVSEKKSEIGAERARMSIEFSMVVSILWAVYSLILIVIGFVFSNKFIRVLGAVFLFLTALYLFTNMWSLGGVYRITASIVFGALALLISFLYAKYKDYIKNEVF